MKKKSASQKKVRRVARPKVRKFGISFSRFIIFTAVALFVVVGYSYKNVDTRAVLGASITRPLFAKSTVSLPTTPGATSFNVYYKTDSDTLFTFAVRDIPASANSYTIEYLKKGTKYQYQVSAVSGGTEVWWSPVQELTTEPM